MGAGGGAVGALAAQLVFSGEGTFWGNITSTSLWSGCASAFIAFFMAWAGEIYHRKSGFPKEIIWPSLRSGAIAGAISGAGAQAIYSVYTFGSPLLQLAFQASCWSIMGALLGWGFARFMPNMRKNKACIGGGIGGFIGGLIFVVVTIFVPEVIGHIIGFAIMGASLGLSLVVAEALFRRAAIEIVWAPNEITTVTLGKDPVYLGVAMIMYILQVFPSTPSLW